MDEARVHARGQETKSTHKNEEGVELYEECIWWQTVIRFVAFTDGLAVGAMKNKRGKRGIERRSKRKCGEEVSKIKDPCMGGRCLHLWLHPHLHPCSPTPMCKARLSGATEGILHASDLAKGPSQASKYVGLHEMDLDGR